MRNVEMTTTLATQYQRYTRYNVFRVNDEDADEWIAKGYAKPTERHPQGIDELFRRLTIGAGKPCLFLPFVGEFGHLCMSHVRLVHFHTASRKVVCCRPGEQALFPSADAFVTDWIDPVKDIDRIGTLRDDAPAWRDLIATHPDLQPLAAGGLNPEQEIYPVFPDIRIPFAPKARGYRADVLLGVRVREIFPERNWQHWQTVADALTAAGLSFAVVGAPDTSYDLRGQVMHTKGDTDAAIELLRTCKLYVGTDSGASHLAALIGARMLTFRELKSGARSLIGRMMETNRRLQHLPDGWDNPELVAALAIALCREADA